MTNRLRKLFKKDKCINEYFHGNSSDIISKKKFKKLSEKYEMEISILFLNINALE